MTPQDGQYQCVYGCLFDEGFRSEYNGKYYCKGHAEQLVKEEFEDLVEVKEELKNKVI